MKSNTTSVTVTFRLQNDDIQGSTDAIKALIKLLNDQLNQKETVQDDD